MMNWYKLFGYAVGIWIILGVTLGFLTFGFSHCNGSCYWSNDFVESIVILLGVLFAVWSVALMPVSLIDIYFLEKNEKVRDTK